MSAKTAVWLVVIAFGGVLLYVVLRAPKTAAAAPRATGPVGGIMGFINDALNTVNDISITAGKTADGVDRVYNNASDAVDKVRSTIDDILY